jgi:MFS family permease
MDFSYKLNIWKMYLLEFIVSFQLIGGVMIPFFTEWGHISFAQTMILQSWFMFWIFALEIPTGAVADYLGRKVSIALSALILGIAAFIYGSTPNFYVFMLGEFLFATSVALMSGADDAFVYDSLKKTGEQKHSKKIFGRIESIHLIALSIGTVIGSLIAARFGLNVPMLLMVVPGTIACIIAITLKEPETKKKVESKRYLKIMIEGALFFYKHKILRILAFDFISIATVAYFMIWLFQPMLKQAGIGIAFFGIVHAAFIIAQVAIINSTGILEKVFGSKKRLLFLSAFIMGVMFIIGGLFTKYAPVAIGAILIGGGFGLARKPLFSGYMNKYIPSEKRATVLSSISMFRNLALVIINPIVGFAVDWSLNYTLIGLGSVAILFAFLSRVEEKHLTA